MNRFSTILTILLLNLLLSCNTKHPYEQSLSIKECTLSPIHDTLDYIQNKDFSVYNVTVITEDNEGTDWSNKTNDSYRFVIHEDLLSNIKNQLLVYKNGQLVNKYSNLKFTSIRDVPVNSDNCIHDMKYERIETSWELPSELLGNEVQQLKNKIKSLNSGKYYNKFLLTYSENYCIGYISVDYFIDKKTRISGDREYGMKRCK